VDVALNATGTITVTPNNTAKCSKYNTNIVYQYVLTDITNATTGQRE
jgi:hypothetical protein